VNHVLKLCFVNKIVEWETFRNVSVLSFFSIHVISRTIQFGFSIRDIYFVFDTKKWISHQHMSDLLWFILHSYRMTRATFFLQIKTQYCNIYKYQWNFRVVPITVILWRIYIIKYLNDIYIFVFFTTMHNCMKQLQLIFNYCYAQHIALIIFYFDINYIWLNYRGNCTVKAHVATINNCLHCTLVCLCYLLIY